MRIAITACESSPAIEVKPVCCIFVARIITVEMSKESDCIVVQLEGEKKI